MKNPGIYLLKSARLRMLTLILLPFAFSLFSATVKAQSPIDYSVHANIIYHFSKYIDWPDAQKSGDFVIGIVGDSPMFEALQKATRNKTVGAQQIIIKKFSTIQNSYDCQILFISEEESYLMKRITALIRGMPVLIVSEQEGLASKGSCINFIREDDKIKLEINKFNIENRKLKIASELLSLGVVVK